MPPFRGIFCTPAASASMERRIVKEHGADVAVALVLVPWRYSLKPIWHR